MISPAEMGPKNTQESNPNKTGVDINIEEGLEIKPAPEELGKQELSPEEQIRNLESTVDSRQQRITKLTESAEATKTELDKEREKLGLPPKEEESPNVLSDKEELKKLKAEQEAAEKQKEELKNQQEKEQLIQEEKEKILQEKLDELFKELEGFNSRDIESILKSGKTRNGKNVESSSMGELDPEVAKSLVRAFKEGIKLLPKILEMLPDLLKKFDEDLTKEATERVNKRLEEEKQKKEEGQEKSEKPKQEEKSETPGEEILHGGIKPESDSIKGEKTEIPKVQL